MGKGHLGEGLTGTTIKDTWTNSRVRVQVGKEGVSAGLGTVWLGVCRHYYKRHMEKIKWEGEVRGGRWFRLRWCGGMARKCRQLYLNNN